jgi:lysophospholipase L1-like esterase
LVSVPLASQEPLERFFSELSMLKAGRDTVISIVHLGDSHIQAGYLSGKLMRLIHQDFGNAGRGFIAPLKLAKLNEPFDYFIRSEQSNWAKSICVRRDNLFSYGLGGVGVSSRSSKIDLEVIIAPKNGVGYAFNQAILYREKSSLQLNSAKVVRGLDVGVDNTFRSDTFRTVNLIDTLLLQSKKSALKTNTYYGVSLSNGNPGVLYHAIGVNGAMYVNYTDSAYVKQLSQLNPSLLVLSLGTNESFGRRFISAEFTQQVKTFLAHVRREMPHVNLLLTTPPACFKRTYVNRKRTYVRNKNTEKVATALTAIAKEQGIACLDLFTLMGGEPAADQWYATKLMSRDRIHFTEAGYYKQAEMIYDVFTKAFRTYQNKKYSPLITPPDLI